MLNPTRNTENVMSNRRAIIMMMTCATVFSTLSLAPTMVAAEEDSAVSQGDIVRRKLLYRSTRFEVAPTIGFTLADSFRRNMLVGANLSYHLTNEWSLGVSGGYGVLQLETELSDNIAATLSPGRLDELSYSFIQWQADVGIHWVPIFGKFSILKSATIAYDFHAGAGFLFASEDAVAAGNGIVDETLRGIRPGAALTFGVRLFLSDMLSLNVDLKNMLFSRAELSRGTATPEFRDTMMLNIGVGIFLPGQVKISR